MALRLSGLRYSLSTRRPDKAFTPSSGMRGLSEKHHVNRRGDNKAIDRERNERDPLNQLQEGFDGDQCNHEGGNKTDGKHGDIGDCQERPTL